MKGMKTKEKINQEKLADKNIIAKSASVSKKLMIGLGIYVGIWLVCIAAGAIINKNLYDDFFPDTWVIYQDKTTTFYSPRHPFTSKYGVFLDLDGDDKEDFLGNGCVYLSTATVETLKQEEACDYEIYHSQGDEVRDAEFEAKLAGLQLKGQSFTMFDSQVHDIWTASEKPLLLEEHFLAVRAFAFEDGQVVEVEPTFEMWWLTVNNGWNWPEWFQMFVALHVLPFIYLNEALQN
jgi:hypothetical protein